MKKLLTLIFLFCLSIGWKTSGAQELFPVMEVVKIDKEKRPAIVIFIKDHQDNVRESMENYFKDKHDVKLKKKGFLGSKNELEADEALLNTVSPKPIILRVSLEEKKNGTQIIAYGKDPDGEGQTMAEEKRLMQIFRNFTFFYYNNRFKEDVVELGKEIRKINESNEKLREDLRDISKDLKKNAEEMKKLEEERKEDRKKMKSLESELKNNTDLLHEKAGSLKEKEDLIKRINAEME